MLNGWRVYFRFAPPSVSQTSCMTGPRIERSMTYVSPNHLTRWGLVRSTVLSQNRAASGAVLASRSWWCRPRSARLCRLLPTARPSILANGGRLICTCVQWG